MNSPRQHGSQESVSPALPPLNHPPANPQSLTIRFILNAFVLYPSILRGDDRLPSHRNYDRQLRLKGSKFEEKVTFKNS